MSEDTLCKWCRKLGFCYEQRNKGMQVYQQFDIDILPPACNSIKKRDSSPGFFL